MSKQVNHNLADLSPPERLWLERIGQGVTQDVAAPAAGLSHRRYVDAELGRCAMPPTLKGALSGRKPALGQLLRLARRRSARQLRPLAAALGISHVTFLKYEREANQKLVRFWCGQGYRF